MNTQYSVRLSDRMPRWTCVQTADSLCLVNQSTLHAALLMKEYILLSVFPFVSLSHAFSLSVILCDSICLAAQNGSESVSCLSFLICLFLLFSVSGLFVPAPVLFSLYRWFCCWHFIQTVHYISSHLHETCLYLKISHVLAVFKGENQFRSTVVSPVLITLINLNAGLTKRIS